MLDHPGLSLDLFLLFKYWISNAKDTESRMGTSRYLQRLRVILHILYSYHQLAHRSSGKCLTRAPPKLLYWVGIWSMGSAATEDASASNILSSLLWFDFPISIKILYCNQIHMQHRAKKRKTNPQTSSPKKINRVILSLWTYPKQLFVA